MILILVYIALQGVVSLTLNRRDVIEENMEKIQMWNRGVGSNMFKANDMIDRTEKEREEMLGYGRPIDNRDKNDRDRHDNDRNRHDHDRHDHDHDHYDDHKQGPPPAFDWRDFGAVVQPVNHGHVGAPAIPAAVATIESAYFRATGDLVQFSVFEVVTCADSGSGYTGTSLQLELAFNYIAKSKRLAAKSTYGIRYDCAANSIANNMTKALVSKFEYLEPKSDYALKNGLMRYPILAAVYASPSWAFYSSGIFPNSMCNKGPPGQELQSNLGVEVVGYAPNYYIAKNSWGKAWGENGYIRLERARNVNPCKLLDVMLEPVVGQ